MKKFSIGRFFNLKLWRYDEDTSYKKLKVHYRVAVWITFTWLWSIGVLAICFFEVLVLSRVDMLRHNMFTTVTVITVVFTSVLTLVLAIPALFGIAIMNEIESEFTRRKTPVPPRKCVSVRLQKTVFRQILFCALPFSVVILIDNPDWLNIVQVVVWMFLLIKIGLLPHKGKE